VEMKDLIFRSCRVLTVMQLLYKELSNSCATMSNPKKWGFGSNRKIL